MFHRMSGEDTLNVQDFLHFISLKKGQDVDNDLQFEFIKLCDEYFIYSININEV